MKTNKDLENKIFETIGEASMLWDEIPTGVFESDKGIVLGNKLYKYFLEYIKQNKG